MDEIEIRPQEASEARETSEQAEIHALDDATFSPGDSLEQVGGFRQAEAIQTSLETVMASIATDMTAEAVGGLPIPILHPEDGLEIHQVAPLNNGISGQDSHQEGPFEPAGEDDDDRDNITPINLPGVQSVAGEEIGAKGHIKGTEGTTEIRLPGTGEEEISEKDGRQKRTEGAAEIPLPGTAGESGWKEQVGDLPTPIPHPAEDTGAEGQIKDIPTPLSRTEQEIGRKVIAKESAGAAEIRLPGITGDEIGEEEDPPQPRIEGAAEIPLPKTAGEGMRTGETATIDQVVARTEAAIEEMSQSFNLQYLQLQNKISHENRQFSMLSNVMKTNHDTAKNSINNIR